MFPIYGILRVIFFISFRPCSSFFFTFSTPAKIEPAGDVIKYVGDSFSLNCTAIWLNTTPSTIVRPGQPISNITRVDSRTIKLDIRNATLNDSGRYICRGTIDDAVSLSSLDIKNVLIAYKLEGPVFITCINYDGESMNCSFQLTRAPDEMLLELNKINVSYSIGNAHELYLPKEHIAIINRTMINCEWKNDDTNIVTMFNNKLKHKVKIVLNSRIDNISSIYTIDPYIYVKPGPVKKLNVYFNTTNTFFTAKVEWSPPPNQDACQTGNLAYNVSIVRNNTVVFSKKIQPACSKQNLSMSVNDLVPFTRYNVKVTCKPVDDGYWSDEAKIYITTPITAPKSGPRILQDFYTTVSNSGGTRTVAVYWQDYKLDERGGPIENYIITIPPLYMPRLIPGNARSVTVDLPTGELTVHVQAKTKAGSSPTSTLVIPTQEYAASPLIDTDVIVEKWNDTSYNISWGIGNNQHHTNINIYYCHGRLSPSVPIVQCITALRAPSVSYNGNGAFVTLPGTSSDRCKDCEVYFAISLNTNTTSSGLIWSVCYFDHFRDTAEPIVSVSVDVDSILLRWQRVCSRTKSRPAILQLSYQQYQYNTTGCVEGTTVNVSREHTQYTIDGLNPGTQYFLCLRTFSEVDTSDWILKNVTTSPIVTETQVNYEVIVVLTGLFLVPCICICICICVCKIRRRYKRGKYTIKEPGETSPSIFMDHTYDDIEMVNNITAAVGLDSNRTAADPQNNNRTAEALLDSNSITEAPLDNNRTAEAPLDSNRTAADPLDRNRSAEALLDSNRTAEAPIDNNRTAEAPIDNNRTAADPLDSNRTAADPLDSNREGENLDYILLSTDVSISPRMAADHHDHESTIPKSLSRLTRTQLEAERLDESDYTQVATIPDTDHLTYQPHTLLNGHCEIPLLESAHDLNSNGYKEQHFYFWLG